jgi:ABC-2 type transport system permease protein
MNLHAVRAIYRFEMARTCARAAKHRLAGGFHLALLRGVRLGDRLAHPEVGGVSYGAFIVPGW